ncbi:MAG: hypothetical protein IKR29_03705 [Bacteroidales bacterium]|nr:hypothetical protein [Bacteroidales bacterium]MBR6272659.1 hypothetical protein [Bacteroidales bacterium]
MKKLATILGAIVIGFTIVSCTGSPKEAILKEVNEFFGQAEAKIKAIDNAGDLMNFINTFSKERDNFGEQLDTKYKINDKGIYKGMNAEGMDALMEEISNRATEYNKVEYAKCGEIMEPYIARLEKAAKGLYELFQAGGEPDDNMVNDYLAGMDELAPYADIVPEELADRYYQVDSLMNEMFGEEEE